MTYTGQPPSTVRSDTFLQIIYASSEAIPFDEQQLVELLEKARLNNAALAITGMLLYHEGSFIQAIEGPEEAVDALFNKIKADHRHENSVLLYRNTRSERSFPSWTMGFKRVHRSGDVPDGLNRFLDHGVLGITSSDGEQIRKILHAFRDGAYHR